MERRPFLYTHFYQDIAKHNLKKEAIRKVMFNYQEDIQELRTNITQSWIYDFKLNHLMHTHTQTHTLIEYCCYMLLYRFVQAYTRQLKIAKLHNSLVLLTPT